MKFSKTLLFVLLICLVFPIASYAGQLEDGTAAMDKGDYTTAYKLLFPLAENGNASAQDCIGAMYGEGLGVAKDESQAFGWYEKAALQGNAKSQNALGAMYVNGLGVEKDLQKGLSYIVKAAQQGLKTAQQNAYALYYQQAQEGNMGALHNVGLMCLKGWGGEVDPNNCVKLLEMAAQNGFIKSASTLERLYEEGKFGIKADAQKSAYWKNFAENPPAPTPAATEPAAASSTN